MALSLQDYKIVTEALIASQTDGVILLDTDGQPLLMNNEARQALNGRPVEAILHSGLEAVGVFRTETMAYHVRSVQVRRRGKILFLEHFLAERDLRSELSQFGLTKREQEIAMWATLGLSNIEIAEKLFICEQTVKDHLQDVFNKMKIHRRSGLAAKLFRLSPV